MDEVCVNVFFVQRGPDCELDARNYVSLGLILRLRTGGCFFDLHVAPHAAVYRSVGSSSNGQELPIGSQANWQTLRPAVNRVLIEWTFQLRSLRVVTQSATLEFFRVYVRLLDATSTG